MQVPLAPMTTLRLGGPAKRLIEASSEDEIVRAVVEADVREEPLLVLGGGSNVVIADAGFDGTVLKIASRGVVKTGSRLDVQAGEPFDELVHDFVDRRLVGIECLAGIPGLAGATPMQNVGAYGQEVGVATLSVRAFDRKRRTLVDFAPKDCRFAYRSSIFRGSDRWVITRVTFALRTGDLSDPVRYTELAKALGIAEGRKAPLRTVRDAVVALRRTKGMVLDPADPESTSAGSFFTNPIVDLATAERIGAPRFPAPDGKVKLPAAWLIEHAGFSKGHTLGRTHISKKHALALVTSPGATTAELLELARAIRRGVHDAFGVMLQPEPVLVGCVIE
jgi:UDP-N-acetylmuramate dehydrogenase